MDVGEGSTGVSSEQSQDSSERSQDELCDRFSQCGMTCLQEKDTNVNELGHDLGNVMESE